MAKVPSHDSHLHGVDVQGLLEAVDALLELLLVQVQQGLGAHGPGAALARQRPRLVVVLLLPQDVSQQAVQGGRLLLVQLPAHDLLRLESEGGREGGCDAVHPAR